MQDHTLQRGTGQLVGWMRRRGRVLGAIALVLVVTGSSVSPAPPATSRPASESTPVSYRQMVVPAGLPKGRDVGSFGDNFSTFQPIPLTCFDTPAHRIQCLFHFEKLTGVLRVDGWGELALPARCVPVKTLDLPGNRLLVIVRSLFQGTLELLEFNAQGQFRSIALPDRLKYSIFRQAGTLHNRVLMVLYNVHTMRNFLYRIVPDSDGGWVFDDTFVYELFFGNAYDLGSSVHMDRYGDQLYLCAENTRFVYDERLGQPALSRRSLGRGLRLLDTLCDQEKGIFGLVQDESVKVGSDLSAYLQSAFHVIDLQTLSEVKLAKMGRIPSGLTFDQDQPALTWLRGEDDLRQLFLRDVAHAAPCGVLDLGCNNYEGQVAWSQVYYLNGLMDALVAWPQDGFDWPALRSLRGQLRTRLDMEMVLLDRLLDEGQPGLTCYRYSVDRQPALYAVQTGRVLRLLTRYATTMPQPMTLRNYARFRDATVHLTGHEESLTQTPAGDPSLPPGLAHLAWPKGSAFPYDGVGVPFNHQHAWADGVVYGLGDPDRDLPCAQAAREIVELFLHVERLHDKPPGTFAWHYWWGQAYHGWTAQEGVSVHRPRYGGNRSMAHISYRTIDAQAVLSVGRLFPQVLTADLLEYFRRAVENEGVYLFVSEDLLPWGQVPNVRPALAVKYLRMSSPRDMRNALWAYAFLDRQGLWKVSESSPSTRPSP